MVIRMNEKQKAFADYYIESMNAKESYKKAYSTCKTEKTAEVNGCKLLGDAKIKAYIQERLASKDKERIASQDEVLEFLTSVMRGEVKDQLGLETSVKDRNKAGELLGKRYAIFSDNFNVNGQVVVFNNEDKLED
jgi:phage terminase small subunit